MPPKLTKAQQTLFEWEYRVAAMGIFDMHESYDVSDVLDKNVRFEGFLEQRIAKMIQITNSTSPFCNLNIERFRFEGAWWDTAIDIAEGKKSKNLCRG